MENQTLLEERAKKLFEEFRQSPQAQALFVPLVLVNLELREDIHSAEGFKTGIYRGDEHLMEYAEIYPEIITSEALGIIIHNYYRIPGPAVSGLLDISHRKYVGSICHPDDNPILALGVVPGDGVIWKPGQVIDF